MCMGMSRPWATRWPSASVSAEERSPASRRSGERAERMTTRDISSAVALRALRMTSRVTGSTAVTGSAEGVMAATVKPPSPREKDRRRSRGRRRWSCPGPGGDVEVAGLVGDEGGSRRDHHRRPRILDDGRSGKRTTGAPGRRDRSAASRPSLRLRRCMVAVLAGGDPPDATDDDGVMAAGDPPDTKGDDGVLADGDPPDAMGDDGVLADGDPPDATGDGGVLADRDPAEATGAGRSSPPVDGAETRSRIETSSHGSPVANPYSARWRSRKSRVSRAGSSRAASGISMA